MLLGFQTFELRIRTSGHTAVGSNTQLCFFCCSSLLCLDLVPLAVYLVNGATGFMSAAVLLVPGFFALYRGNATASA